MGPLNWPICAGMGTDYNDKTAETGRPWNTEYIRQRMATLQKTIEIFLESKSGRIIFLKTNFFCKYKNAFTFFLVTSGLLPLLFKQCVFNLFLQSLKRQSHKIKHCLGGTMRDTKFKYFLRSLYITSNLLRVSATKVLKTSNLLRVSATKVLLTFNLQRISSTKVL